jgi:hypothetical protein
MCIGLNKLGGSVNSQLYIGKDILHGLTPRESSGKNSGVESQKEENSFPTKGFSQNPMQGYTLLHHLYIDNYPEIYVGGYHWFYNCIPHPKRITKHLLRTWYYSKFSVG